MDIPAIKGAPGEPGKPGTPGYTPVNGVDYFTPEEVDEIKEEVNTNAENYILEELAKRGQIKPEFANSIEECTDTSKMYVLPDGNIYAYMSVTGPLFTNQLPKAVGVDGTPFGGGTGFEMGYLTPTGTVTTEGVSSNGIINYKSFHSGFIPYNGEKIIRASGFINPTNRGNVGRLTFFESDKSTGIMGDFVATFINEGSATFDQNAFNETALFTFDLDTYTSKHGWYGGEIASKAKYIRISWNAIQADNTEYVPKPEHTYVTYDEEISFGTAYEWTNTGHAFVPADYEDRIVDLEKDSESHETRIKALEVYGTDSTSSAEIPAYIKAAADEVIEKVISQQGSRSFTMIGLSDFHYGGVGDNKDNLIRACKAINYIEGRINVDAVATLGDNIPHGESTEATLKSGHRWFKEISEILKMTQQPGIIDFRTPGNHDRMGGNNSSGNPTEPMPDNAIYSYITGYNRQCEIGDVPGGWAYKDFAGHKLRVIVLNTSEVEGKGRFSTHSGFHMSTKQYRWVIDTLDLSGKTDAADWQILILSHHRADDWQVAAKGDTTYILPNILNAYKNGGSYTGINPEDNATISCDFAGKNVATLIGQIHGHHHAYIYGYLGLSNGGTQTNVMAISTPTTGFGTGAGHNDDNDGNWYDSIKDAAEETAFCLYSIDLDNQVVNAIHYGNGIDRVITY